MNARDFEKKHAEKWQRYEELLKKLEKSGGGGVNDMEQLPKMLRERCAELSLARHRMYGGQLCEYLNQQVSRGHKLISRKSGGYFEKLMLFVLSGFPRAVRREWRLFVLCWLFFLIPLTGMLLSVHYDLDWVRSILGSDGMAHLDSSYGEHEEAISDFRGKSGADFMMFGHYIHNNIGIDFQIIAGGLLAGVGSLFVLLMNGLGIGGAMAYVLEFGSPEKFFTFVAGHSSYELTGMVVAGMAGMRIGLGLLNPGRMTRGRALLESGKRGMPLVFGAFLLTFIAACVEGFWSARELAPLLKYSVGIAGWVGLTIYFIYVGRGGRDEA